MFYDKSRRSVHGRMHQSPLTALGRLAAAVVLGAAIAGPAQSQNFSADVGSSERINLAGQLGTLSQRIISSACNLNAGIAVSESRAVLDISATQFGRISDALLHGNRGFGILGEETRPRTLQVIESLNTVWGPVLEQAVATEVNANDSARIEAIAAESNAIISEANILVSEITGQYADPVALLHADALLIDLAGRQRMAAMRMSKDVCLIASGIRVEESREELRATRDLFATTLNALQNGLDSVGVMPPPTTKIADGLQYVADEWAKVQRTLDAAIGGAELTPDMRQEVFFAFLGVEARMNNVAVLYDKNSKLNL